MDFSDVARSSWQLVFVVSIRSLYYMSEFWLSCEETTKNIKHILQQGTGELLVIVFHLFQRGRFPVMVESINTATQ